MTQYSVLVANEPLKEMDCSGIKELTVRELKKLYPITETTVEQPWHSMDDDVRILHAADELAFGRLNIFEWDNPPCELDDYNQKAYIYGVEGNWDTQFIMDLRSYLRSHITQEQKVELLRFWAGDGYRPLEEQNLSVNDIELHHLESLKNEFFARIVFE
ncbi:hypothetical protein NCCP2222_22610 [Sporosarcina sp. NCCP-2222]|uniref:hypothetical protein n=1 Tax=Sporosarcina sp. NCCP-2222 TaxID=2935073 RepID=UPI002087DC5A|nr:hypothetical protein [Sporosarcina sp. NCCP-2222]GKV56314.1 hypothetical protein NCCP2222_22610 [Sporosarcina sp. NCCP-2222]